MCLLTDSAWILLLEVSIDVIYIMQVYWFVALCDGSTSLGMKLVLKTENGYSWTNVDSYVGRLR